MVMEIIPRIDMFLMGSYIGEAEGQRRDEVLTRSIYCYSRWVVPVSDEKK